MHRRISRQGLSTKRGWRVNSEQTSWTLAECSCSGGSWTRNLLRQC